MTVIFLLKNEVKNATSKNTAMFSNFPATLNVYSWNNEIINTKYNTQRLYNNELGLGLLN